ncbi:tRNA-specific adenosine deaminase [Tersicoccus solisilvae]|uniref:tRNA-specific adenosine deaminase n=1 Tax=Tersicoccus solisilvae TaxID=1882339 RepID=A0ABQ1PFY8_9MICC|nr:nucleoside deaminase [Tersicoccus solisilvae]GGC96513.1 tRNA-specific adenosine deaminase [Tersicoccus solisilvae]
MAFDYSLEHFARAREAAAASLAEGGVPIGGALVLGGELVATGHNQRVQHGDPTAHGEIDCLRAAGRIRSYADAVLYTTLAPCAMCSGAIVQFGIRRVVVGEATTFGGELDWMRSRGVDVVVLDDPECRDLMTRFATEYPAVWAEDIGEVE